MTLKELNNLQHLNGEIKTLEESIADIHTRLEHITPNVHTFVNEAGEVCVLPNSGGSGTGDKIADDICALIEEEQKLCEMKTKRHEERIKLLCYIDTIEDSLLRRIFMYRFYDGLSWLAVANKIGGGNTEDSVKKQVYRFLIKNESCPECPDGMC